MKTLKKAIKRLIFDIRVLFGRAPKYYIKNETFSEVPIWKGAEGEGVIEYAFTIKGRDYFRYASPLSIGNMRGNVAVGFIEEFYLRFTKEHFYAAYEVAEDIMNNPHPKINDMFQILRDLKDRRDWVFEPITVLKLASVLFFDRSENPYKYDWDYNQKKIKRWLEIDNIMIDFFLRIPLVDSMIHLELSERDLATCIKSIKQLTKAQQKRLIDLSHNEDTKNVIKKLLSFEVEILDEITSKQWGL